MWPMSQLQLVHTTGAAHSSCLKKKITRYNQMIVAIVDVLTSFDVVTNDNR